MRIEELGAADAVDFWALRLRALREEPEAFGSSYDEQWGRPVADVARDLAAGDGTFGTFVLGAFAPRLVAMAGLRREPRRKRRHRAGLWGMYVSPEVRGQGIGRALVVEIVRRARAVEGLEQIILTVMAQNQGAVALYRALGFEVYGHAPRAMLLGDRAFDEELMRLELNR